MRLSLLSLLPLLLISGCNAPGETHAQYSGTSWRFVSIDGDAPVATETQLTFEKDRIGANVGCNGMGGPWRIEDDRLIAGPLVQTEMFCEGTVWDQEKAIGALLAGAPKIELEGDRLVLKSSSHAARLERES